MPRRRAERDRSKRRGLRGGFRYHGAGGALIRMSCLHIAGCLHRAVLHRAMAAIAARSPAAMQESNGRDPGRSVPWLLASILPASGAAATAIFDGWLSGLGRSSGLSRLVRPPQRAMIRGGEGEADQFLNVTEL